jgi:phage shock protein C
MTQSTYTAQQQPYSTPAGQPYRPLRRSRDNRMVAGICAGAARYLNIDPVAARVLFVVAAVFSGGTALVAYVIAWFVMPEDDPHPATYPTHPTQPTTTTAPTD